MMNTIRPEFCREVHLRTTEIIQELIGGRCAVRFDVVMNILLTRFGVMQWQQLGLGDYRSVPIIFLLFELSSKIDMFLLNYLSVRSIITLVDIDIELTQFLVSFGVPSLTKMNEELLNGSQASPPPGPPKHFEEYGLGPLHFQPIVRALFLSPLNMDVMKSDSEEKSESSPYGTQCNTCAVLQALSTYLSGQYAPHSKLSIDIYEFDRYLCEEWHVSSLQSIGIYLQDCALTETIRCMTMIQKEAYFQQIQFMKDELENVRGKKFTTEELTSDNQMIAEESKQPLKKSIAPLKVPKSVNLQALLDECKDRCIKENGFSPSKAQIRQYVEAQAAITLQQQSTTDDHIEDQSETITILDNQPQQQDKHDKTSQKMPRRRKKKMKVESIARDNGQKEKKLRPSALTMEAVMEATVEYLFLHMGNKRYTAYELSQSISEDEIVQSEDEKALEDNNDCSATVPSIPIPIEDTASASCEENKDDQSQANKISQKESNGVENMATMMSVQEVDDGLHPSDSLNADVDDNIPSIADEQSPKQLEENTTIVERTASTFKEGQMKFSIDASSLRLLHDSTLLEVIPNDQLRPHYRRFQSKFASLQSLEADEEQGLYSVGHRGEQFVYHFLQQRLTAKETHIVWMNAKEESKAGYDISVETNIASTIIAQSGQPMVKLQRKTVFVEVKTTRFVENNVFTISWWEWMFALKEPRVAYHLYRVYAIDSPENIHIVILKDIPALIQSGKIKLCLAI